ncbi:hypothetical protein DDZ13_13235 [Coraliomargarita sinensis]|uniref:DUF2231 domain-containing protein n=1 Tax=Coraliomargarita sinensis TaxID=2174842 RepID=A0A317ZEK1_9BACT|nr:DUF2231 domain-containing protein [Coraliomargarita sinensis]PXA03182.1 hypothetical protein DDZ13_13235 [Coraliomargarita sinensis]
MITTGLLASAGADGLSSMWRIELLHPAVVHFSVALTVVGSLFYLVGLLGSSYPACQSFRLTAWWLLLLACLASWASLQTGFWADHAVGRELFDPRPLKDHERFGLGFSWVLSATVLVEGLRLFVSRLRSYRKYLTLLVMIGLVASCGLVAWTSHLGAGLVYQQGAGVQMPSEVNESRD